MSLARTTLNMTTYYNCIGRNLEDAADCLERTDYLSGVTDILEYLQKCTSIPQYILGSNSTP